MNNNIQVKSGLTSDLKFQVQIEGSSAKVFEVRLTLRPPGGLKISYIGKYENGIATFNVFDTEKYCSETRCSYDLEIFLGELGDLHFVPFSGVLEIVKPISVKAGFVPQKDSEVTIKASSVEKSIKIEPKEEPKGEETKPYLVKKIKKEKDSKVKFIIKL